MLAREELISRKKMASTGGLSQNEKEFRDSVFSMAEMVQKTYLRYAVKVPHQIFLILIKLVLVHSKNIQKV
jgi:hypothetical protein